MLNMMYPDAGLFSDNIVVTVLGRRWYHFPVHFLFLFFVRFSSSVHSLLFLGIKDGEGCRIQYKKGRKGLSEDLLKRKISASKGESPRIR